jgi:peptidoglycan hydrolase-like protein with peptidoglycan-binding domain
MRTSAYAAVGSAVISSVLAAGMAAAPVAQATVPTQPTVSAVATAPLSALVSHASVAQALQPWPVLREGSNSLWPPATVRSLQYLLDARGARLAVDGQFGPKTRAAVVAFQRSHGLSQSGVVYTATWQQLVVAVRQGSIGPAVRAVQDQINFRNNKNGHTLAVDGIFGPKTKAAVTAFQRAMSAQVRGFAVDGIVGAQTWQALVTEALSG